MANALSAAAVSDDAYISLIFIGPENNEWPSEVTARGLRVTMSDVVIKVLLELYAWPTQVGGQGLKPRHQQVLDFFNCQNLGSYFEQCDEGGWKWAYRLDACDADGNPLTETKAQLLLLSKYGQNAALAAKTRLCHFLKSASWFRRIFDYDLAHRRARKTGLIHTSISDGNLGEEALALAKLRAANFAYKHLNIDKLKELAKEKQPLPTPMQQYVYDKIMLQHQVLRYRKHESHADARSRISFSPKPISTYPSLHLMAAHLECRALEQLSNLDTSVGVSEKKADRMLLAQSMINDMLTSTYYALASMNIDEEIPKLLATLELCAEALGLDFIAIPMQQQDISDFLIYHASELYDFCGVAKHKLANYDYAKLLQISRRAAGLIEAQLCPNFQNLALFLKRLTIAIDRVPKKFARFTPTQKQRFAANYIVACSIADLQLNDSRWIEATLISGRRDLPLSAKKALETARKIGTNLATEKSRRAAMFAALVLNEKLVPVTAKKPTQEHVSEQYAEAAMINEIRKDFFDAKSSDSSARNITLPGGKNSSKFIRH